MPFRAGQTFQYPLLEPTRTPHLWVIATIPTGDDGLFACVSFTSLKWAKDQTVTLFKSEHPFLKWDTCIAYAFAEIISSRELQSRIEKKQARLHQDASPTLLKLICDGFLASNFTKNRVRNFVALQRSAAKGASVP